MTFSPLADMFSLFYFKNILAYNCLKVRSVKLRMHRNVKYLRLTRPLCTCFLVDIDLVSVNMTVVYKVFLEIITISIQFNLFLYKSIKLITK